MFQVQKTVIRQAWCGLSPGVLTHCVAGPPLSPGPHPPPPDPEHLARQVGEHQDHQAEALPQEVSRNQSPVNLGLDISVVE